MKARAVIFPNLIVFVVLAAAGAARSQSKPNVTLSYDRFKDQTALALRKTRVAGSSDDDALFLSLAQASEGRRPSPDAAIGLNFFSVSAEPHFSGIAADRELIFLADGERIRMGNVTVVDTKPGAEWVMTTLPLETLTELAKAKTIEGKVGDREFALSALQISALREFLRRIVAK